jgi:enoyl-CoA hydratase
MLVPMVRVERSGAFSIWTINRPESKNALNFETLDRLWREAEVARTDPTLRAIVLTGAGDAFASGGDLRELRDKSSAEDAAGFADAGARLCSALESLPVPVIAAIPGPAYGGGAELAMACDLRIAEPTARLSFKQVRMGVTTAWGTIGRLVATVGHASASRLLYTGHEVLAANAMAMGLVDAVCESGTCIASALAWASDIALGSPQAVAEMKALLRATRIDVGVHERARFIATWSGPEHAQAIEAYFSRRPPPWTK